MRRTTRRTTPVFFHAPRPVPRAEGVAPAAETRAHAAPPPVPLDGDTTSTVSTSVAALSASATGSARWRAPTELERTPPPEPPRARERLVASESPSWPAIVVCGDDQVRMGQCVDLGPHGLGVDLPPNARLGDAVTVTLFFGGTHDGIGAGTVVGLSDPQNHVGKVRLRSLRMVERRPA